MVKNIKELLARAITRNRVDMKKVHSLFMLLGAASVDEHKMCKQGNWYFTIFTYCEDTEKLIKMIDMPDHQNAYVGERVDGYGVRIGYMLGKYFYSDGSGELQELETDVYVLEVFYDPISHELKYKHNDYPVKDYEQLCDFTRKMNKITNELMSNPYVHKIA